MHGRFGILAPLYPRAWHKPGTSTQSGDCRMRIFFSVGEPSGDLHGANLIRQLQRRTTLVADGLGGPKMQAAGCDLLRDMSDLAVMGFFTVLAKLPQFWRLLSQVERSLDEHRPDAVVLID